MGGLTWLPGQLEIEDFTRVFRWLSGGQGSSSGGEGGAPPELEGLLAFDSRAIAAIHTRYYPEIYRFARYRVSDVAVAEDIASEVFVRMLEAVEKGRGPRTNLRGWLISTASNTINDHFRRTYRRQTEELSEDLQADNPGLHAQMEAAEQQAAVRAALARLTPEQQNVLALRFGSGYSLEETARLMGKKANAIKALQFRALATLRRHLEEAAS